MLLHRPPLLEQQHRHYLLCDHRPSTSDVLGRLLRPPRSRLVLSRNRAWLLPEGGGVRGGWGGGRVCFMRATDALLRERKAKQA